METEKIQQFLQKSIKQTAHLKVNNEYKQRNTYIFFGMLFLKLLFLKGKASAIGFRRRTTQRSCIHNVNFPKTKQ